MKKVTYFTFGDMLPADVGNKKAMFAHFSFLVKQPEFKLTLCIIGNVSEEHQALYREMGADVKIIKPSGRWSFFEILNKIGSRLGLDMLNTFFSGLAYRRQFTEICRDADAVVMIYAAWFELLPKKFLKEKTIVFTYDLFFYRRASIHGTNSWWKRLSVNINRRLELHTLRKYRKIAVLAGYERKMLVENGIPNEDILEVGIPITVPECKGPPKPFAERTYDFFLISSSGPENQQLVRRFVEKVVPLLPADREYVFALAGGICKTADVTGLPPYVKVEKLGFVPDPEAAFADAKFGVGTVVCGSGVKVKVVEMAMYNLPLITSDSGAEGIPLTGDGFVNIDQTSAEELREKLLLWLDNPILAQREGEETGAVVRWEFSAERIMADLKDNLIGF